MTHGAVTACSDAQDACTRFAKEVDFEDWRQNLQVYGLDFRDLNALQTFCAHIRAKYTRLDALVNNACQTIRRPAAYYAHLLAARARCFYDGAESPSISVPEDEGEEEEKARRQQAAVEKKIAEFKSAREELDAVMYFV